MSFLPKASRESAQISILRTGYACHGRPVSVATYAGLSYFTRDVFNAIQDGSGAAIWNQMTDCDFPIIEYSSGNSAREWGLAHGEQFRTAIKELTEIRTGLMREKNPSLDRSRSSRWPR